MNAHEIIRALGGATKVAASTHIPRSRIANWQTSGIPGRYWPILDRLARKGGVNDVTMEALEKHRKVTHPVRSGPSPLSPSEQARACAEAV